MKNLELLGVQEMNAVEMREFDGGILEAEIISWLVFNFPDMVRGFNDARS